MKRPEQIFQQRVAQYLEWALPHTAFWTHFPAGGGGKVRGAFLKSMGLKSGVPDIMIIYCGHAYWIELKALKRKATQTQILRHIELVEAGCKVAIAHSIEQIEDHLTRWGVPLKAGLYGQSRRTTKYAAIEASGNTLDVGDIPGD